MSNDGAQAVLITGAGGGVGVPTATAFAERGYRVYAGVRDLAGTLGLDRAGIRRVLLDVTDPASIAAAMATIAAERGEAGLQVLVNNAGVMVQGPQELLPDDELHRQFDVNVYGPQRVLRAALPLLRAGGGRVINISAVTALVAPPFFGPIAASKAALESLSEAARVELAPWRIPVAVVELSGIDTALFAKAEAGMRKVLTDADPELEALYHNQLDALAAAQAKQPPGPVAPVVKVILRAAQARRPKARYTAGSGAGAFVLLSRLPARLRDRLITTILGLGKAGSAVEVTR